MCVTVDDVKNDPACCPTKICCPDEVIEQQIEYVIAKLEYLTCTKWCPEEECRTFQGTGQDTLYFGNQNLISLISIESQGCCQGCSSNCKCNCNQIEPELNNDGNSISYKCCDSYFPCGDITVCGIWGQGLDPIIKNAIIKLTMERVNPGSTGMQCNQGNVKSEAWTDYTVTYGDSNEDSRFWTTGFNEIDLDLQILLPTSATMDIIQLNKNCGNCSPVTCNKGSCGSKGGK